MMLTIRDVEEVVCARFHLTPHDLRSRAVTRAISRPRMIAMYLARQLTGNSLPSIGRHFDRDHTTVLAAVRKAEELVRENRTFHAHVEGCRELLSRHTPWKKDAARAIAGVRGQDMRIEVGK